MPMPDGSPDYPEIATDIGLDQLRARYPALTGAGITVGQVEGSVSGVQGPTGIDTEVNPADEGHLATNSDGFFTYIDGTARTTTFDDGTIGTESSHADLVATYYYDDATDDGGAPTGVAPGVAHVDSYDAYGYLTDIRTSTPDRVVNLSVIYENSSVDANFDTAANTYGTVFVAAAGNGGTPGAPSDAYDVISVDTSTVVQAIGPAADGVDKPDISAPGLVTSYATPVVSGAATLMVQAGTIGLGGTSAKARADAVDFRTIKALLLNGAVKPADYYTTSYAPTATQPLNAVYGAGVVNIMNSVTQLVAGEVAARSTATELLGAAHAPALGAAPQSPATGWNLGSLTATPAHDSVNGYGFSLAAGTIFTTTLTWAANNSNAIDRLGLYLYDDTTGTLVASSDATTSNVQQINFAPAAAGTYDLEVLLHGSLTSSLTDKYALAFADGVACFCAGTRILSPSGEVAVERLRPGDAVVTAAGRIRPIRFVGHRRLARAAAVRIRAGAMGQRVPHRDLLLSPEHALALRDAAGLALVPVHRLRNDVSIADEPPRALTYFHIELDSHDVILAEGLPVETYLDTGNRAGFDNAGTNLRFLHPPPHPSAIWSRAACAPLVLQGPRLAAWHAVILARVGPLADEPAAAVLADGVPLPALAAGPGRLAVRVPAGRHLRLRSRSFHPDRLEPDAPDSRRLGLAVTAIRLGGRRTPFPAGAGWHAAEAGGAWCWTDGDAALDWPATPEPGVLSLTWLSGLGRYLVTPGAVAPIHPLRSVAG